MAQARAAGHDGRQNLGLITRASTAVPEPALLGAVGRRVYEGSDGGGGPSGVAWNATCCQLSPVLTHTCITCASTWMGSSSEPRGRAVFV